VSAVAPARLAAWRTLVRVRAGATLPDALSRERDPLTDARDRSLAQDLATGVLRWRSALDAAVAEASTRPLDRLDADVLDILRLGVYQLRHRDRLPAHAIVSDAVALTRAAGHSSAAGFVNAVLRRLTRGAPGADAIAHAVTAGDIAALAIHGAHPAWLVERWVARLGLEAAAGWLRFDNAPPSLTLRPVGPGLTREAIGERLAAAGVTVEPTRWAADGLVVLAGAALDTDAARAGLFVVQDEASQLVGELAAAWGGVRRLDVCAAPGGKTLALRGATPGGLVVAGERRPRRVRLLRETLGRTGATEVRVVLHDATAALPYRDVFDVVLVDAPCSGLGTLRREPDLKWRRAAADLAPMADVQRQMLARAARTVAPGGVLVYATCSSEPEENDDVADAFLETHPAFRDAGPAPSLAPGLAALIDPAGRLRTSPAAHGLEAFYAACLRRG
jgi:16S rRNA (cytosine967-C5)-methyltransferase